MTDAGPARDLLVDFFGRIRELVVDLTDALTDEAATYRPDPEANSIAWLVWHLARIQDDHMADLAGVEQVWTAQGWARRFGLPFDDADTGYGHSPTEVDAVRVAPELLTGYLDEVHEQSVTFVSGLGMGDLDRIVDERWDPPVSLGVRLVSVINDDQQHVGQAAYVRGLIEAGRAELVG